jgi:pimeloyl-ACP methyl ester carboxylesterase
VALASGQAARYTIFGELCLPPGINRQRVPTVHLAVHGATRSHLYWGWPYQPDTYSYVDHLLAAGYAVFAIDRIGVGQSSHPAGASVTIDVNAFVVHQLVWALRSGSIGKTAFQRVMLVGHSLGSITSLAEASAYHDVDGVVLTGISHFSPSATSLLELLVPANRDPRVTARSLDDDYLTTPPGSREASVHSTPVTDADPQVVALDEATKETVTRGELTTMDAVLAPETSSAINVPVLMVTGQFDPGVCGGGISICASSEASAVAFAVAEAPFFAPEACLQTIVIPNAGPDLNLERSAPETYAAIRAWSDAYVGLYQAAPPCRAGRIHRGSDEPRDVHSARGTLKACCAPAPTPQ